MQSTTEVKTSLKVKEHHFKWTIDNWKVSSLMNFVTSEPFAMPDVNTELSMILNISNTLNLFIYYNDSKPLEKCSIEAFIVTIHQKIKLRKSTTFSMKNKDGGLVKIVEFESSENYSTSDELAIICEVKYGLSTSEISATYDKKIILNDFDKLFSDKKLCDVVFLKGQEEIGAHTAVLAAVSPYFLAMFDNPNTIENQKRIVDFTNDKDVTADNLRGFLEYIYGAKSILELSSMVSELFVLADKFRVEKLLRTCEYYMSEKIDGENVVDILILSDKYHCELLKKKALSYAKMHIDVVKASDKFNELCKIADVMRNLL